MDEKGVRKFRPEGDLYIWGSFIIALILGVFKLHFLSVVFLVITLFMVNFFRDPERVIVYDPTLVLSPADGRVIKVERKEDGWLISIFMSIFDCHVNRAPVTGVVKKIEGHGKGFKPAFDRDATHNVAKTTYIEAWFGTVKMTQITGIIARRILLWVKEGSRVEAGDRIGMIMFGSRVDLFIPGDWEVFVREKMKVKAGETILGRILR
ncbi:MAG: phosphatidylserine decarboxylase [Thermosulfidibacteraceae bacterium]|jgi:phosphatidylserine decarboxylase